MLATIKFEYYAWANSGISREDYAAIRSRFEYLQLDEWREAEEKPPNYWKEGIIVDLSEVGPVLAQHKVEFIVKRFKGTYVANPTEPVANHVHVHIPNVGLLFMNEVTWKENCCTEELQRALDDGWRIIAVCPPNSQRRPDYILGRSKGE